MAFFSPSFGISPFLKVTFISESVFLRVYLEVGLLLSDVTSPCVCFFWGGEGVCLWNRPWDKLEAFYLNE